MSLALVLFAMPEAQTRGGAGRYALRPRAGVSCNLINRTHKGSPDEQ